MLFIAFFAAQAGLFPPLSPSPSHPAGRKGSFHLTVGGRVKLLPAEAKKLGSDSLLSGDGICNIT